MAERKVAREVWKAIPGYEGYAVSDLGRVRSIDREVVIPDKIRGSTTRHYQGRILKQHIHHGYKATALGSFSGTVSVHCLVALAFLGKPPLGCEVAHNNGLKADNRLTNLRYDTVAGNSADRLIHGTDARGEKCPTARLSLKQIRAIRRSKAMGITLAKKYGVTAAHICNIRKGHRWRWADDDHT
jgi:hypothetical protein